MRNTLNAERLLSRIEHDPIVVNSNNDADLRDDSEFRVPLNELVSAIRDYECSLYRMKFAR